MEKSKGGVRSVLVCILLVVLIVGVLLGMVKLFAPRLLEGSLGKWGLAEEPSQTVEKVEETVYHLGEEGEPEGLIEKGKIAVKEAIGSPQKLIVMELEAFLSYREMPFEAITAIDHVTVVETGARIAETGGIGGFFINNLKANIRDATFEYEVLATVDLNRMFAPGAAELQPTILDGEIEGGAFIVHLPHAEVKYANLESVSVEASVRGIFVRFVEGEFATLEPQMITEAREDAIKEAIYQGILQAAEDSAEEHLRQVYAPFLEERGYKLVVVFGGLGAVSGTAEPDPTPGPVSAPGREGDLPLPKTV